MTDKQKIEYLESVKNHPEIEKIKQQIEKLKDK